MSFQNVCMHVQAGEHKYMLWKLARMHNVKQMHESAHTYTRAHVVSLCSSFDNNIMCVRVFTRALHVQQQGRAHMHTNARAPMVMHVHKQVRVADVRFSATVTTACTKRTGAAACAERMRRELDRAIAPE